MKVVILAGGFGTRIRDVAENIPKPLIPIGSYPILWHIMKYYASYGHTEFIICLGHKGNEIRDFFINYKPFTTDFTIDFSNQNIQFHSSHNEHDWKITLAETGKNTMTGARIAQIQKYIGDDDFFLTYGDGLGDINIDDLTTFHKSHGKTLTVSGVRPPGRFGEITTDKAGFATGFNEKPQTSGGRISGGYFIAKPEIFNYLSTDPDLVFEQQPMKQLVKDKQLLVFNHDGFWQPMDTSREFKLLNELFDRGEAPWVVW